MISLYSLPAKLRGGYNGFTLSIPPSVSQSANLSIWIDRIGKHAAAGGYSGRQSSCFSLLLFYLECHSPCIENVNDFETSAVESHYDAWPYNMILHAAQEWQKVECGSNFKWQKCHMSLSHTRNMGQACKCLTVNSLRPSDAYMCR